MCIIPLAPSGNHTVSVEPWGKMAETALLHEKVPEHGPPRWLMTTSADLMPRSLMAHAIFASTCVADGWGPAGGSAMCGDYLLRKLFMSSETAVLPLRIGSPTFTTPSSVILTTCPVVGSPSARLGKSSATRESSRPLGQSATGVRPSASAQVCGLCT